MDYIYFHFEFSRLLFSSQLDKYIPMKSIMALIQSNKFIEIVMKLKNGGSLFDYKSALIMTSFS